MRTKSKVGGWELLGALQGEDKMREERYDVKMFSKNED